MRVDEAKINQLYAAAQLRLQLQGRATRRLLALLFEDEANQQEHLMTALQALQKLALSVDNLDSLEVQHDVGGLQHLAAGLLFVIAMGALKQFHESVFPAKFGT